MLQRGSGEGSRRSGTALQFLAVNDFQGTKNRRFFCQSFIKQILLIIFKPGLDQKRGLPTVRDVMRPKSGPRWKTKV